ncbi:MAG: tRNA (adenine-N1)-methyltransferase, partial [Anaerolineae bacterium]|nr:tRNA (adenine-N1)-methyltransferase [Anaerolineae bacterium]
RYYKPSATRLRPVDRMVAHTGFLIFARRVTSISETDEI